LRKNPLCIRFLDTTNREPF